jgi:hypothetical protein
MEIENVTNPDSALAGQEVTEKAQAELTQETPPTDEQQEAEGDEQEQIELEEVEHNGKRYAVPKELVPSLMKDADYTQKTQQTAEMRRELEAERQSLAAEREIREALFQENAQLLNVDQQLEAYRNTNWQQWLAQDPNGYHAAKAQYDQLRDMRDRLAGHVQARAEELSTHAAQATQARLSKAVETLSKPDPKLGWDGKFDDAKKQALASFGKEIGFSDSELAGTDHPLMIKTLQLAKIGFEALKRQSVSPARTPAEPAARVPAVRSSSPFNPHKASMEEYAAARRAGKVK